MPTIRAPAQSGGLPTGRKAIDAVCGFDRHAARATVLPALAFALAMSVGLPLAFAQTPASSEQGQEAQSDQTETTVPSPAQGQAPYGAGGMPMMGMGQGGMMGQGGPAGMGDMSQMMGYMGRMMSDMGQMMGQMRGGMGRTMPAPMMGTMMPQRGGMGMPFQHVEGRLAFLKTELKITPAQEPEWNKFADAYRAVAKEAREKFPQMMPHGGPQTVTATERMDRYEQMLALRLDAVRTMKSAFDPLYAALSPEQKKTADQLLSGPAGLM